MSSFATDEHGRPVFAHDALSVVRERAIALANGREEPYAAGREIWGAAFDGTFCKAVAPDPEHCKALWLLWGALTDWIALKPDESAEAERTMRRAATEWLEVADDESKWRAYFEHWLYAEMEYDRPAMGA
jgi:hypothetical protein